jgi:hypothetical protein
MGSPLRSLQFRRAIESCVSSISQQSSHPSSMAVWARLWVDWPSLQRALE